MKTPCLLLSAILLAHVHAATPTSLPPAGVPPPGDSMAGYEVAGYEIVLTGDSWVSHLYDHKGKVGERDFRPKAGAQKLGYTYFDYPPGTWVLDHPLNRGWHRLITAGTTPYWNDRNGDHRQQPEELSQVPYQMWSQIRTRFLLTTIDEVHKPEDLPSLNGNYPPARRYVEKNMANELHEFLPGLGDAAWYDTKGSYANQWQSVVVIRGPAILEIEGTPLLSLGTGPGTPLTNITTGARQQGDLRKLQASPDSSGYLGMTALADRFEPLVRNEIVDMARDFVKNWDAYLKVKVGPGPHFKGHYLNSADLLPTAAELPGTSLKAERRDIWSSTAQLFNPAASDSDTLMIDITAWGVSSNMPWANSINAKARDEFETHADGLKKQENVTLTNPVIAGLDDVLQAQTVGKDPNGQITYRTTVLVFRVGNVKGSVMHYCGDYWFRDHPTAKPLLDQPMTALRAIAARAAGLTPSATTGEATLSVKATPAELWADGQATVKLHIETKAASGAPLGGIPLEFAVSDSILGQTEQDRVTTDTAGRAEMDYRVHTKPGTNTIAVTGAGLTAKTEIRQGGIETIVRTPGLQFLADGSTPIEVSARLLDPEGRPVPTAVLDLQPDESELPERGQAEPVDRPRFSAEGWTTFTYTPPLISPDTGWRGGRITLTATNRPSGNAPALAVTHDLTLHSGASFWLVIGKPGYAKGVKTPFSLARRNGTVTGQVLAQTPTGPAPLMAARVEVHALENGHDVLLNFSPTSADGRFSVEFALEKMAGASAQVTALPAILSLDPETQHWLDVGRQAADRLKAKGYPSPDAEEFLQNFPRDLAASSEDPTLPRNCTRLVTAAQLMGQSLGYFDELDDQHSQAMGWLIASLESGVDSLAKVVGISDKVKSAQQGLADYYRANPSLAPLRDSVNNRWADLKRNAVGSFLTTAYGALDEVYSTELPEEDSSSDASWRKWIKNKADEKLFASWVFNPVGSSGEALEQKFKTDLLAFLKRSYLGDYPTLVTAALNHLTSRIGRGDFSWENPDQAASVLRETFAAQAAAYTRANTTALNRELTRLDLKLAADTVGKGAAIYFTAKEAVKGDPAEFQAKIEEAMDNVDSAVAVFDTAYQTYNGQQWFAVCHRARVALADIALDAVGPGRQ